jgi:hypothetical protein
VVRLLQITGLRLIVTDAHAYFSSTQSVGTTRAKTVQPVPPGRITRRVRGGRIKSVTVE